MNPRLAALPVDPKRKIIVPYAQVVKENGEADFAVLDPLKTQVCAIARLCGLCGQPLSYWIVFIGGPGSLKLRTYVTPPMHVECAEDAFTLCPHLSRPLVMRRPASPDTTVPQGWVDEKPDRFAMLVTRSFTHHFQRVADGGMAPIFRPAPAKTVRWWSYVDGRAVEETGANRA